MFCCCCFFLIPLQCYFFQTTEWVEKKKSDKENILHLGLLPPALKFSSDTLWHVQWCQHLFKYSSLHVGTSQVGFLKITARQITILQDKNIFMKFRWRFRVFSVPSQNDSWGTRTYVIMKISYFWKTFVLRKKADFLLLDLFSLGDTQADHHK